MITHHVPPELMLDFATGALSEPVALAVASHIAMCGACRGEAERLRRIGGVMLADLAPMPLSDDALDRALARLTEPDPHDHRDAARSLFRPDAETREKLPPPMRRILGRNLGDLDWTRLTEHCLAAEIPLRMQGFRASLVRIAPGGLAPDHFHRGPEYAVIFTGGYSDGTVHRGRGDFGIAEPATRHQPVADAGVECLCLAVYEARSEAPATAAH